MYELSSAEIERLASVDATGLMDSRPEAAYDAIVEVARNIAGVPIALVSLIDKDRQWFKARVGLDLHETPRGVAFCDVAIATPAVPLIVEDAAIDLRFADNPMVIGDPHIRFYAGFPIVDDAGRGLGTLCVMDRVSRQMDSLQIDRMKRLATVTQELVRLRVLARDTVASRQQVAATLIELHRSERRLASLIDPAPDPVVRVSTHGLIEAMNPVAIKVLSHGGVARIGHHISTLAFRNSVYVRMWGSLRRALDFGESSEIRPLWLEPASGPPQWCQLRILSIDDHVTGARSAYVTTSDITAVVENEKRLAELALVDPLTGAANRVALEDRLNQALGRIERETSAGVAVAMIDLDNFKAMNDAHGHAVGDNALRAVVDSLRTAVRSQDTVARLGGDEFVVMVDNVGQAEVLNVVAPRLLEQFENIVVDLPTRSLNVAGSIGVAWSGERVPAHDLLARADAALLRAKRSGRHRLQIAESAADGDLFASEFSRRRDLDLALASNQFSLRYQPIQARNGEVTGIEALLRWEHPDHGTLVPAHFIDHLQGWLTGHPVRFDELELV
jgi:diguanylate cyclase (GGDEF)-like protein